MIAGWHAWLPTDPSLRLAAQIALGLAITTAMVMVQVLAISAWAARERQRRDQFSRDWRPELAVASLDAAHAPAQSAPRGNERLWWLLLWNRMQRQVRGDASARLNRLLRRLALEGFVLRLLRRRDIRNRLIALEALRYLADVRYWDTVAPLVQAGNPFVALAAAEALIAMDAQRAMELVLPTAVARRDWGVPRLVALCRQAGREAVTEPLLQALDAGEPGTLDRMVPLLGHAHPHRTAAWARGCLQYDPDPVHRQAALLSLGELGDPHDRGAIVRAFGDEDAAVRLAALEAFRRHGQANDAGDLLPLLADRSWWVRQRVADTLVSLPGMTLSDCEALLPQVEDAYGRQALERAIGVRAADAGT